MLGRNRKGRLISEHAFWVHCHYYVQSTLSSISGGCDQCANNPDIDQCTVNSGWQCIMWVFYVRRSREPHQRRFERCEERPWIKPAAEQRVKYLQERLGRLKGRLCIKPAAVSSDGALKLKTNSRLGLFMWVNNRLRLRWSVVCTNQTVLSCTYIFAFAKEDMFYPAFVSLFVCLLHCMITPPRALCNTLRLLIAEFC